MLLVQLCHLDLHVNRHQSRRKTVAQVQQQHSQQQGIDPGMPQPISKAPARPSVSVVTFLILLQVSAACFSLLATTPSLPDMSMFARNWYDNLCSECFHWHASEKSVLAFCCSVLTAVPAFTVQMAL